MYDQEPLLLRKPLFYECGKTSITLPSSQNVVLSCDAEGKWRKRESELFAPALAPRPSLPSPISVSAASPKIRHHHVSHHFLSPLSASRTIASYPVLFYHVTLKPLHERIRYHSAECKLNEYFASYNVT